MAQHTINLPCVADAYVDYNNPSVNHGSDTILKAQANSYSAYLKFSDNAPVHKKLINLYFKLYCTSFGTLSNVYCACLTADFSEMGITASNQPGVILGDYFNIPSNFGWALIDLSEPPSASAGKSDMFKNPSYLFAHGIRVGTFKASDGVYGFHSRENTNKPYLEVTYEDSPPLKPTTISPSNQSINLDQPITLDWDYRAEYGGDQKAYQCEWRLKGDTEWNAITGTSTESQCVVPAGTFANGNIEWRVKTFNEYDEESPYSDVLTFYAIGQPAAPTVFVQPSAKPVITWDASEQQLWQLQILSGEIVIYDTGNQPGVNVYSHTVSRLLDDGSYTAKLRVRNTYEFWSDWAEYAFAIATEKPTAPTLSVDANGDYGIAVRVDYDTPKCLLYRREIGGKYLQIAYMLGALYIDNAVVSGKRYEYKARAIAEDNSFADSAPKSGMIRLACSVISLPDGSVNLPLRFRFERGKHRDFSFTTRKILADFVGREYSCVEKDGKKESTLDLNYFILTEQRETLEQLNDAPVMLYRNDSGDKFYGTLNSLSLSEAEVAPYKGYDASFAISRVSYTEGVAE